MNQVDLSWHENAACKGKLHIFYGPYNERTVAKIKRETIARSICATCPVLEPCRKHARENPEYGFWGGESEEERYESGTRILNPIVRRKINKQNKKSTFN